MDKATVIALARQAGWQYADGDTGYDPLWRFAALVAAHEREECAKVCEDFGKTLEVDVGDCFAEAIRSRT